MKINVHQISRGNSGFELLVVTSNAEYCKASVSYDSGFVSCFGGTVWPGQLPEVFRNGPTCAQQPLNVTLLPELLDHFKRSVGSVNIERKNDI